MQRLAAADDEIEGRGVAVRLGDNEAVLGGASQELTLHPLADDFGRTATRHGWKSEGRSRKSDWKNTPQRTPREHKGGVSQSLAEQIWPPIAQKKNASKRRHFVFLLPYTFSIAHPEPKYVTLLSFIFPL